MTDLGPSARGLRAQDAGSPPGVPPGAFSWATVHSFSEREGGQVKAACASGGHIYTTNRAGVRRWDAATGRSVAEPGGGIVGGEERVRAGAGGEGTDRAGPDLTPGCRAGARGRRPAVGRGPRHC
jgi:hypothetical protein